MAKITINKGTSDEKEYVLNVSFNTLADSEIMDEFQSAMDMSDEFRGENAKTNIAALKPFFATVRNIFFACLQDNHADEIKSVQDAGKLIDKMTKERGEDGKPLYDLFSVFDLVMDAFEDAGFLSGESEATEKESNIVPIAKQ